MKNELEQMSISESYDFLKDGNDWRDSNNIALREKIETENRYISRAYDHDCSYAKRMKRFAESDYQYEQASDYLYDASQRYDERKERFFQDLDTTVDKYEVDNGVGSSGKILTQKALGKFYDEFYERCSEKNQQQENEEHKIPEHFQEIYNSVENGVSNPEYDFDEFD